MSYSLRNYRHRNPQKGEDQKSATPFFKSQDHAERQPKKAAPFFQAKLAIGQPGDSFEREADAVADKVVRPHQPGQPVVKQNKVSSIQRLATSKEDEKFSTNDARMEKDKEDALKPVQRKAASPGKEKKKKKLLQKAAMPGKKKKKKGAGHVQRKAEGNTSTASPGLATRLSESSGKGSPLPAPALQEMQTSFGADFSGVNIHTGKESEQLNEQLGAQAFTIGNDIYFNQGKFNPQSPEGKRLLAHELTHVIQQEAAGPFSEIQRDVAPQYVPETPPPGWNPALEGGEGVVEAEEGLTVAEELTLAGEGLLGVEAAGGAEVEAVTGPPGWIVGAGVLLTAGALIGLGYLLSDDKKPDTQTDTQTEEDTDEEDGCEKMIASGIVNHECWQLDYDFESGYPVSGSGYFNYLKLKNPGLQQRNVDAPTTSGPCPGIGTHTNVYNGDGSYFGSIVCCPCCLQEEGATLASKCHLI